MEGSEGGLLASELPVAPSRPSVGQWLPHGVRRASLGHSGGPAPDFHRLPRPPIRWFDFAASYRRSGQGARPAAAGGFRLRIVKRSGEPGVNPGLTRNGDGCGARSEAPAPSPNAHRSTHT